MIGFTYTYKNSSEMLDALGTFSHAGPGEFLGAICVLAASFFCIFILLPGYIIIYENNRKEKERLSKKNILTQILLQKEIEDEVEKEIIISEEQRVIGS